MIKQATYKHRRKRVFEAMADNSIALMISAPEYPRTNEMPFTYRQDANFYYLTGVTESHCAAIFLKAAGKTTFYFFSRPHDPVQARWIGDFLGQERALSQVGADEAFPIDQFEEQMGKLLENRSKVYYSYGRYPSFDQKVNHAINALRIRARAGVTAPNEIINLDAIVYEMRLFKDADEIEAIQKSVDIDVLAQKRAMKMCRPGMFEYELEAEVRYEFTRHNAREASFDSIVAGGANACTLHYFENRGQLREGDLVLVDIGCEYEYYASDLTRTFPVNGKFSPEQKAIYEVVLEAQLAAIKKIAPGQLRSAAYDESVRVITEGLCRLGILSESVEEAIRTESYKRFYMHNIGHWMGVEAHDVGAYFIDGNSRQLEPGIVLTIEPGIYISANEPEVDPKWWNIGVRIEDDVLVTEKGHYVLSSEAPKSVAEIEACMRGE